MEDKKIKTKQLAISLILIVIFFGVGFLIGKTKNQLNIKSITQESGKRLDSLISLETSKGLLNIVIVKDSVWFQPFEDASYFFKSFSISKEKYPKLFEQGIANSSFISAKLIDDKNGQIKIEIANNQPDHGTYSSPYRLKVDPITKIVEEIGSRKYTGVDN